MLDLSIPSLIIGGVIVVLLIAIVIWLISIYNGLVRLHQRVEESWSGITVQLKRRADLIPNLISTVQGYATHEQGLFERVTAARSKSVHAQSPAEAAAAEPELTSSLRSVFAVAEGYPQLQASGNFLQLQQELSDTEDKVQAARRFYNSSVRDFNTKIRVFPHNLFVRSLGFSERQFFEVNDPGAIAEPPRVQF
ncbi:LemA family protein [Agrococcus casei]|uniref:LemA family protein n=1 Tax=Agrococcus casei TaxID=343512 RepID=UPI003F8FDE57